VTILPAPSPVVPGPASSVAAPPATAPEPNPSVPAPAVAPDGNSIALVLPLESALYGRAAAAVKAGFLAAAGSAGGGPKVQVIGHGDDGVLPAVAAAVDLGARLIVGPLTRDDLKSVLALAPVRPRMLALNQTDDGSPLPPDTYAIALSIESDAALLARRAWEDGIRTVATVASDAPLQRRFRAAFSSAWDRAGGRIARDYRFDTNTEMLALLRRELAARGADATLLCVAPADAALAKSFLVPGPVYAVSQITDGLPAEMLRDLEGVRYVEIPWLAEPEDPAFARLPRTSMGDPVLDRLYALGLDAFVIAELLASPDPPARIELDGATGHLSMAPNRTFAREGRIMVIRAGAPTPYARQ
jgi:outer membrane PBP1 activator LpoA protein